MMGGLMCIDLLQNDLDDPERGMIFVCSATHKTKSMFFFLAQTEQGDIFKVTLETDEEMVSVKGQEQMHYCLWRRPNTSICQFLTNVVYIILATWKVLAKLDTDIWSKWCMSAFWNRNFQEWKMSMKNDDFFSCLFSDQLLERTCMHLISAHRRVHTHWFRGLLYSQEWMCSIFTSSRSQRSGWSILTPSLLRQLCVCWRQDSCLWPRSLATSE